MTITRANTGPAEITETSYRLRAVSRGIAIGKAVVLHGRRTHFKKTKITKREVSSEIRKFDKALSVAKSQLGRLMSSPRAGSESSRQGVFEAQLMMLADNAFSSEVKAAIERDLVSSQWAVRKVADSLAAIFRQAEDEHFREKALDIDDVAERVLLSLGVGASVKLGRSSIIVAHEIGPSIIAELTRANSCGIVAERGGWTSHGFILAREIGVPAVTGLSSAVRKISNGDTVIVDGFLGRVFINPSKETLRHYKLLISEHEGMPGRKKLKSGKVKTLDGIEIVIRANVDGAEGYRKAKETGAQGIGLFRSELLLSNDGLFPSESKQVQVYRSLASASGKHGAKIRTFDIQIDGLMLPAGARERNPALGLRAVRLMLEYPDDFRTQIRSLLKASSNGRIDILIPMVSDIGEIEVVKDLITAERQKLRKKGLKVLKPAVGAMIEVPAAVLMAQEIAQNVDFLCIGTNDLVQYTLAVDRDNQDVADHYRSVHPAVLRSIKAVVDAGLKEGKPVIVCGEMASSPVYVAVLIGLGVRELSMNPKSMERVRFLISGISMKECRTVASKLLTTHSADDAEQVLSDALHSHWADDSSNGISRGRTSEAR